VQLENVKAREIFESLYLRNLGEGEVSDAVYNLVSFARILFELAKGYEDEKQRIFHQRSL